MKRIGPAAMLSDRGRRPVGGPRASRVKQVARDFCTRTELRIAAGAHRLAFHLRQSRQILTQAVARFRVPTIKQGGMAAFARTRKLISAYRNSNASTTRTRVDAGISPPRAPRKPPVVATALDRFLPWASLGIVTVCGIVILVL